MTRKPKLYERSGYPSMRIMLDTNVIIDVLLDRKPFSEDSSAVLSLCEEHFFEAFVSASAITDIFYLVRKHTNSTELAYNATGTLLRIVDVCSVTNENVMTAFNTRARDFEDCLVAECAKSIECECIITRNKKDFSSFGIDVLTPAEALHL